MLPLIALLLFSCACESLSVCPYDPASGVTLWATAAPGRLFARARNVDIADAATACQGYQMELVRLEGREDVQQVGSYLGRGQDEILPMIPYLSRLHFINKYFVSS